jgi:sugar phosphate isomerase/epimerase
MRIGLDGRKIPEASIRGSVGSLERAHEIGMEGLFFRTVLDMSPTLDHGVFRAVKQKADELGLYVETGLGKVNPYANPEAPELRAAGDGDIVLGFRRMMEAAVVMDCRELWVATANHKGAYYGRFAYDRFRTDVNWPDQLQATEKFLRKLAPIARDLGIHMNLETHEEITSFELVRLVEAVGPDVVGIVFDTANVLQRVEHPVFTARRIAPYVRQTHIKDGSVTYCPGGVAFQIRTAGQGMVDFGEVLPILAAANPELNLSIENEEVRAGPPNMRPAVIEIYNADFLAGHPDLSVEEFAAYMEMVRAFDQRIAQGERETWETVAGQPAGVDDVIARIKVSAAYLRQLCEKKGLPLRPRRTATA